jgi:hypothetical protein
MPVVHPVGCGIDVHQARLTACLRGVEGDGQVTQEVREFATTGLVNLLRALRCDILVVWHCQIHFPPCPASISHAILAA